MRHCHPLASHVNMSVAVSVAVSVSVILFVILFVDTINGDLVMLSEAVVMRGQRRSPTRGGRQ